MANHKALKLLAWDQTKKKLTVQFDKGKREVNLLPLFQKHPALKGIAILPKIEDGGLKVGPIKISGPTAYHMAMPVDD